MTEQCKHLNWYVKDTSAFGKATCKDCGKELWVSDALNGTTEYMQALIKELEAIVNVENIVTTKKPGRPKKNG
jgi:hypothetical protein